jgi:hypothetical protein
LELRDEGRPEHRLIERRMRGTLSHLEAVAMHDGSYCRVPAALDDAHRRVSEAAYPKKPIEVHLLWLGAGYSRD